jgi:hypothetical protein
MLARVGVVPSLCFATNLDLVTLLIINLKDVTRKRISLLIEAGPLSLQVEQKQSIRYRDTLPPRLQRTLFPFIYIRVPVLDREYYQSTYGNDIRYVREAFSFVRCFIRALEANYKA